MKRLIKYTDQYKNDDGKFCHCSTDYEVLPYLVENDASNKELRALAKQLGFTTKSHVKTIDNNRWSAIKITHSLKIGSKQVDQGMYYKGDAEERNEYLGFITLPKCEALQPIQDLSGKVSNDQFYEILNNQELSFYDAGEIDGSSILVIEDWDAFHGLDLLGYGKFTDFLTSQNIEESYFNDSVFSCGGCNVWDHNDSGYTYNYRIVDCEQLGTNCGCAHEAMKNNIDSYINDPNQCIESEVASELETDKTIERLETFIGGMVDGRGGYINGESVREGEPSILLVEFQEKYPDSEFVFAIEESGQFQTYFSIYKLTA